VFNPLLILGPRADFKKMLRIKIDFVRDRRFFISHAFGLSSWCFFKVGRKVEEGGG
jgi:hypothetical protein